MAAVNLVNFVGFGERIRTGIGPECGKHEGR